MPLDREHAEYHFMSGLLACMHASMHACIKQTLILWARWIPSVRALAKKRNKSSAGFESSLDDNPASASIMPPDVDQGEMRW